MFFTVDAVFSVAGVYTSLQLCDEIVRIIMPPVIIITLTIQEGIVVTLQAPSL